MKLLENLLSLAIYRRRGTGATTRMLEQVRPNDIVITATMAHAGNISRQLKEYLGLDNVKVICLDQLDHLRGREFNNYHFDHYALQVIFNQFYEQDKSRNRHETDLKTRLLTEMEKSESLEISFRDEFSRNLALNKELGIEKARSTELLRKFNILRDAKKVLDIL